MAGTKQDLFSAQGKQAAECIHRAAHGVNHVPSAEITNNFPHNSWTAPISESLVSSCFLLQLTVPETHIQPSSY